MDIELEELAAIVELIKGAEFSEFRYEKGDLRVVIKRGEWTRDDDEASSARASRPQTSAGHSTAAPIKPLPPSHVKTIEVPHDATPVNAPLLGTFYQRPKPGAESFVAIGDVVEADTVVCIVEVMKLMNSVVAGSRGVVAAIHANDGDLVEFGQQLFSLSPVAE